MKVAVLVAALFLVPGCSAEDLAAGTARQGVIGGEVDPGHPAVGSVITTNANGQSWMTGVLVAPDKVLTGVVWDEGFTGAVFEVVGSDGSTVAHTYTAASLVTDPDFVWEDVWNEGHAISVLTLREPVPPAIAVPIPISFTPPVESEEVRLVGFGETAYNEWDTGTKRQFVSAITSAPEDKGTFAFGDASHSPCAGDLGAPLLRTGDAGEELVGLSFGGAQLCDGTSYASRVDVSRSFLDEQVPPVEPEPDAGVVNPDAGVAGDGGGIVDEGGGCAVAPRSAGSFWVLAILGLLCSTVRRRRRRRH